MYDKAIADRVLRILRQIPHEGATRAELLSHMKGYSTDKRDLSHTLAAMRRAGQIKFKQKPGSRSNRLGTWHYVPMLSRPVPSEPRRYGISDYEPPDLLPPPWGRKGDINDILADTGPNPPIREDRNGLVPLLVGVAIGGVTGILMVLGYLAL